MPLVKRKGTKLQVPVISQIVTTSGCLLALFNLGRGKGGNFKQNKQDFFRSVKESACVF